MSAIPFTGEDMICVMCGKVQKSDPEVESQWRLIELDGHHFYACPKHFPDDRTATVKKFSDAYYKVISKCIKKLNELRAGSESEVER
jgi:hypothetical protein